jgi:uncharacterized membrane protein
MSIYGGRDGPGEPGWASNQPGPNQPPPGRRAWGSNRPDGEDRAWAPNPPRPEGRAWGPNQPPAERAGWERDYRFGQPASSGWPEPRSDDPTIPITRPAGGGGSPAIGSPRSLLNRTTILIAVAVAVLLAAGTAGAATYLAGNNRPQAASGRPNTANSAGVTAKSPSAAPAANAISLSATGDIVMGMAPNGLPPNNGKGFFNAVRESLRADLQMGNLEQTLTEETGVGKCSAAAAGKTCFQFRTPPSFAQNLADAGFGLLNQANNHAYDFGPAGYKNTQKALDAVGIKYTGWPGLITVVDVKGVKVAVVGFASYPWSTLCSDLPNAANVIKQAAGRADLVVVQVHQGAEGADKTHVRPGTEYFLGENRCDPIRFAHTVIDAGADLVVGHGPHVVRPMEFYKGRLIAYSLGNFAGYKALGYQGVVGITAVIKVSLKPDGAWAGGTLIATHLVAPGLPRLDPDKGAIKLIGSLTKQDFPQTGPNIGADGTITAP